MEYEVDWKENIESEKQGTGQTGLSQEDDAEYDDQPGSTEYLFHQSSDGEFGVFFSEQILPQRD